MKTRLFILIFVLSVSLVLCACDAKRRAQRRIRRITERCPELVTVQAHPIDTFIELPPLADTAVMPLAPLLDGQAVKIQTEQGIFTATARTSCCDLPQKEQYSNLPLLSPSVR